jgi:predicted DNA-binding transcriptional regulator AlpA
MNTIEKKVLSEKEAAKYIGFSSSFLRSSRCYGNIGNRTPAPNFIKVGKAVRYRVSDLDKFLDQHVQKVG